LSALLVAGCSQKPSTAELQTYIEQALPIMERHTETTETTNQANRAFLRAYSSGSQKEIIETLVSYKDTLEWALNRVDLELLDFKALTPPPQAMNVNSLMIDGLLKEQAGLTKQLSYYSSVLRYGFGNDKELDDGNKLLFDAQRIWVRAKNEIQDLTQS